jgi:hypothetical protein
MAHRAIRFSAPSGAVEASMAPSGDESNGQRSYVRACNGTRTSGRSDRVSIGCLRWSDQVVSSEIAIRAGIRVLSWYWPSGRCRRRSDRRTAQAHSGRRLRAVSTGHRSPSTAHRGAVPLHLFGGGAEHGRTGHRSPSTAHRNRFFVAPFHSTPSGAGRSTATGHQGRAGDW